MPKLAKNIGREKNNLAANEVRQHATEMPRFFFFCVGGWRCWGFLLFPMCLQQVPNMFPNER
jgi:hypothetical protein